MSYELSGISKQGKNIASFHIFILNYSKIIQLTQKELENQKWKGDSIDRSLICVLRHCFFGNYFVALLPSSRGDVFALLRPFEQIFD